MIFGKAILWIRWFTPMFAEEQSTFNISFSHCSVQSTVQSHLCLHSFHSYACTASRWTLSHYCYKVFLSIKLHKGQKKSSEQCWPESLVIQGTVFCRGDELKSCREVRGGQRRRKIQVEEEENSGYPRHFRINPEKLFRAPNCLRQEGDQDNFSNSRHSSTKKLSTIYFTIITYIPSGDL